jgi:hypothetical protein
MMSVSNIFLLPIVAVMALFLATSTTDAQQLKAIPRRMRNEGMGQRRFELLEESKSREAAAARVQDTARLLLKMDDFSMSMSILLSVPTLEEADMSMSMWTVVDELDFVTFTSSLSFSFPTQLLEEEDAMELIEAEMTVADELEQSIIKDETAVREADLIAAYENDVEKMNSSSGSYYGTAGNLVVLMLLFVLCWAM